MDGVELLFLGTAAAEGWPGLFCKCDVCRRAAELGGKDLRARSAIQIGKTYQVDWPPDILAHKRRHALDLARLEHLFVTHAHSDHFAPVELAFRKPPYAHGLDADAPLFVYGTGPTGAALRAHTPADGSGGVEFVLIEPLREFTAGALRVLPVPAAHAPELEPVNFVFEVDGAAWFHGYDTGPLLEETWRALAGRGLDLAILDCTNGREETGRYHLGVEGVRAAARRLREEKALAEGARVVATHFSHNGKLSHAELEAAFEPDGILVAYDGMRLSPG